MQIPLSNVINYMKIKVVVLNFFLKNKKIILPFFAVLFFISLYFLIDFSSQSLVAHDEGLYARRARLIESSANWFSPPFTSPHHKTLGSYWFTALSIRLFGNSELALRLPSILSSFFCLISSYLIAFKITNRLEEDAQTSFPTPFSNKASSEPSSFASIKASILSK